MQQIQAKRKVGGKHNRKFERRSRNRQPHTAASSFRLCGFHRKNQKETIPAHKLWISSIAQSMCCRPSSLPSEPVLASGASSTCWKVTEMTIRGLMLMCGKVTNDNLIDSSHYFRNTDQYEKLMWGFSYISFCLSKHFGESDVFVSFLLTASL
jgi:hypothetical protein